MAAHNDSRKTKRRSRPVGGRPRGSTLTSAKGSSPAALSEALDEIRKRLGVASAATAVVCAALKAQRADLDIEAALVLQRCVCGVLADECDRLGRLAAAFPSTAGS